jgi:hypothetical protein
MTDCAKHIISENRRENKSKRGKREKRLQKQPLRPLIKFDTLETPLSRDGFSSFMQTV